MNASTTIALYLRLSLDDGTSESESIAGQRSLLMDYVADRAEFDNCNIMEFSDDGYSGTDFERPAVKNLLGMVREGKVDCIIVKDFSRFGRNYIEVGDYLEQIFPFLGVRFISVNNNFDSQTQPYSAGSLDVTFKNLVNELYSKDISKKVKAAKQAKIKRGEFMAGCPRYGYVISKERKNRLVIDPIAAANVRRIFELFASGSSTAAIASLLNAEQIPTRAEHLRSTGNNRPAKGISVWTQETIATMLRDETYIGTYMAGKSKVAKVGSSNKIFMPKDEWFVLPDNHEAIVSKEIFLLAQERLGQVRFLNRTKRTHLFSGKVYCANCRHALSRRVIKTEQNAYFLCKTSRFADCGCLSERLPESELCETVLCAIKKQAELALSAEVILSELQSLAAQSRRKTVEDISMLKANAEKLKQSKVSLYERYKAGELSKEAYIAERERADKEISDIYERLEENEHKLEQPAEAGDENQFVQRFKEFFDAPCLTQPMVQALVSAIYVYDPDSIEITWNFADDYEHMVYAIEKQAGL